MRIALGIEYDGTAYNGWQKQTSGIGIQSLVEVAIAAVANHPVEAVCAGRTDAGVHASGQVVHFDSGAPRSLRGWLLGVNSNLPADINATWASLVRDDFHARYSAQSRSYRYLILNRNVRSALYRHRAWWLHRPLAIDRMREAAKRLHGEHDFSAFRAAGCQSKSPVREVFSIDIDRQGDWVSVTMTANAFLQHMVRNVVGLLVAIGYGDSPVSRAAEVLAGRDRCAADVAAPAHGLTLVRVSYPKEFALPSDEPGLGCIPDIRI
jgi:tRNA pseudouridine38-40 synthase